MAELNSGPIKCLLLDHGFHNYTNGPCCHAGEFDAQSYAHLHQHPIYIEIKQSMDQGHWHPQCGECSDIESRSNESSYTSKRKIWADLYRDLEPDVYRDLTILSYDVGKLCNLACRSCGPKFSSSWLKEYNVMHGMVPAKTVDYDHARKFVDLSDQSFRDLKSIELLGGEPLYNPESYEIMRRVIEETDNQCMINITSNGTIFPDLDQHPWFKNNPMIVITFSVDATGPAAEFIRTGTNWSRVESNIRRYQDIGVRVGYHITHSLLNLFELDKIEDWRKRLGLPQCKVETVVSNTPNLTFTVLTELQKARICSHLADKHGRFLIPYIESSEHNPKHRTDFFKFMDHTRRYHGLDWKMYLPDLWKLIASED